MKCVLSIAGSDSSGGAGIQADIKTITAHGLYAMTAIAALTAQNTLGVREILQVPAAFVGEQLDCIFEDIKPHAVKIGMLATKEVVELVAERLWRYEASAVVLDPVMVSTSGSVLLQDEAVTKLREELFPLATVITPNVPEAEVLCGFAITNDEERVEAARHIAQDCSAAILIKGGHLLNENRANECSVNACGANVRGANEPEANINHTNAHGEAVVRDMLYSNGQIHWFESPYSANPNTHGTGCTLSAAIACNLARGHSLTQSITEAKHYLSATLAANLNLGTGKGPLNHTPQGGFF